MDLGSKSAVTEVKTRNGNRYVRLQPVKGKVSEQNQIYSLKKERCVAILQESCKWL